jgi:hypothetical protein
MSTIDDFAGTLTSTGHDDLVTVLQAMADGMYRRRSAEIADELVAVVKRIDEVNNKREQLSGQRSLLDRLVRKLDTYVKECDADLEMELFRIHLFNQLDKLKVRIADTRPDDELKRKHDLTQELLLLEAGRKIAIEVLSRIARAENAGSGNAHVVR